MQPFLSHSQIGDSGFLCRWPDWSARVLIDKLLEKRFRWTNIFTSGHLSGVCSGFGSHLRPQPSGIGLTYTKDFRGLGLFVISTESYGMERTQYCTTREAAVRSGTGSKYRWNIISPQMHFLLPPPLPFNPLPFPPPPLFGALSGQRKAKLLNLLRAEPHTELYIQQANPSPSWRNTSLRSKRNVFFLLVSYVNTSFLQVNVCNRQRISFFWKCAGQRILKRTWRERQNVVFLKDTVWRNQGASWVTSKASSFFTV